MFAHVTNLRYWKSERADLTTCEDASRADPQRGLFCVADGAGSTLFSNIWAEILVEHFVRDPLTSIDLFEMDWWIRQAQKRYRELSPQTDKLLWNARQKAVDQGAYATLATLRFLRSDEQSATAELLAVGDSCVIIGQREQERLITFPLQHAADFIRAPACMPALLKNLNRNALAARQLEITLTPGASIILATDAVAHWILQGGTSGQESRAWYAFQEIASKQSASDWRAFIDNCRADQSMVDDDSTALLIHLAADGQEHEWLGSAAGPSQQTIEERVTEFEQARTARNNELLAIFYGDGQMLQSAGLTLPAEQQTRARQVAEAMREILQAMREAVKTTNFVGKIEPIWWQHADLLMDEPCAETIRKTLTAQGARLKPAQLHASPQPQLHPHAPAVQPAQHIQQPQPAPADLSLFPPSPLANQPQLQPAPSQANAPFQPLSGNEPEAARIFSSSLLPPAEPGALLERLKQFLREGTPQQKIEAWRALAPNQLSLSTDDQLQLRLAQRLLEALQSNHDDQIYDAYHKLEFSTLSKHFSFTLEDLQRIQKINNARTAIQQWRTTLRSAGKSVRLLVDTYQMLPSPHSFLSPEELHIAETAQAFVHSTMDEQQTIHAHGFSRVHLYDELFFSPYHFTFTASETKAIEQERELLRIPWPLLAQVNQTRIDGAQFFALFITIPLFAETQVSPLVQQQAKDRSVTRRQELQEYITYWRKLSEPYALPGVTLDTLVRQALLEQGLNTEAEKSRRALEKEILQIQDEYFKELRAPLAREERKTLLPLSEQHWRGALLPFAQQEVLTRHLQTTAPGQTLENWLSERRHAATIRYHERPAANSPLSLDQHASWPFKWWFLRPFIISQQGETEHA